MNAVENIPPIRLSVPRNWQFYIVDTIIAIAGSLLITAFIGYSHLYPRITTIIMLYLLLVVLLAALRSRYSAIFCAFFSFLAIDFFLVPPLFTLSIEQLSQFIALLVFLAVALIVSQLTGLLRRHAEAASASEHKLRVLYELLRVYSSTSNLHEQLDIIALSTARVFSSWGVAECAILLPCADNRLEIRADAPIDIDAFALPDAERQAAQRVFHTGKYESMPVNLASQPGSSGPSTPVSKAKDGGFATLHLLPLHEGERKFGVLYLCVRDGLPWLESEETMQRALRQYSPQATFFWSYFEQLTTLVDRALTHANLLEESKRSQT